MISGTRCGCVLNNERLKLPQVQNRFVNRHLIIGWAAALSFASDQQDGTIEPPTPQFHFLMEEKH